MAQASRQLERARKQIEKEKQADCIVEEEQQHINESPRHSLPEQENHDLNHDSNSDCDNDFDTGDEVESGSGWIGYAWDGLYNGLVQVCIQLNIGTNHSKILNFYILEFILTIRNS